MTDLLQVLQDSVAATEGVIARIDPSAWEQPNPNPGWSNQDALDHLVKVTALIAKAFGAELGEHCSGPAAAPDFGEVAAKMLGAMKAPGAFDGVATLPWGEAPRASVLPLAITEVLLHGWDLAAGTDQAVSWDDDTAQAALDIVNARPAGKDGGPYGVPVSAPENATLTELVVARSGRNPRA